MSVSVTKANHKGIKKIDNIIAKFLISLKKVPAKGDSLYSSTW